MTENRPFGNLFISAGAMKAGTTWLYGILQHHPDLHFSPEKEIHYFYHRHIRTGLLSDRARKERAEVIHKAALDPRYLKITMQVYEPWAANFLSGEVDDRWYAGLFIGRTSQIYNCDFSNLYALLPQKVWTRIESKADRLRVLYTMRDPIKRLWSHLKFDQQINGRLDQMSNWTSGDFEQMARRPFIWDNAEYGRAIRHMKSGLSEQALKIISFEDSHERPAEMIAEIEDFLGIRHHSHRPDLLKKKVNASADHAMPDFFPGLFRKDMERIRAEIAAEGVHVPENWQT